MPAQVSVCVGNLVGGCVCASLCAGGGVVYVSSFHAPPSDRASPTNRARILAGDFTKWKKEDPKKPTNREQEINSLTRAGPLTEISIGLALKLPCTSSLESFSLFPASHLFNC